MIMTLVTCTGPMLKNRCGNTSSIGSAFARNILKSHSKSAEHRLLTGVVAPAQTGRPHPRRFARNRFTMTQHKPISDTQYIPRSQ